MVSMSGAGEAKQGFLRLVDVQLTLLEHLRERTMELAKHVDADDVHKVVGDARHIRNEYLFEVSYGRAVTCDFEPYETTHTDTGLVVHYGCLSETPILEGWHESLSNKRKHDGRELQEKRNALS